MAESTSTPPPGGAPQPGAQAEAPSPRLTIVSQYIKDLSFENPRAPASLEAGRGRPEIGIRVDVRAQDLGANDLPAPGLQGTITEQQQSICPKPSKDSSTF
jgi:preprotein translocase subunit SecB